MNKDIFGKGKDYMSYSAYSLWKRNPEAYRRHYYDGEKTFETIETRFGSKVHEMLENNDPSLSHVPHYSTFEYPIEVVIEGNKIRGRIDSIDMARLRFLDFKTGHTPWTKLKVRKLDQMPFYSMLLKEAYGKVDRICHLVWIETEFDKKSIQFDGHELTAQTRNLRLTGKVKKFKREISKWERTRIKKDLLKVCEEIKKDYAEYIKRGERIHVEDIERRPQEVSKA